MTLEVELMVDYVGVPFKIHSLGPIVCDISQLKCICNMILTFNLEGQGHKTHFVLMVNYVCLI